MPDSVLERIIQVFELRLGEAYGVNPAFGSGDNEVFRPTRRGGIKMNDKSIVVHHGNTERIPNLSSIGNPPLTAYQTTVLVNCIISPSESSTVPVETEMDNFAAYVHNAIASKPDWYKFDHFALNANLEGINKLDPEDESARGVELEYSVVYRVSETDHFEEHV